MNKIVLSLFLSGLLLGSGPCLATCGPILISYIAATKQNSRQGALAWLLFSLSRIFIYLVLSLAIFLLGEFLVKQNLTYFSKYIYPVGGMLIVLIGIFTMCSTSSAKCESPRAAHAALRSTIQPITLGLIMGLLPCMPLLAVLSYIGLVSLSWQRCILFSLIFGLGTFFSPLILLVLATGVIPGILFNRPKIYRYFRLVCGFIIVFFGVQLIFRGIGKPVIF